MDALFANCYYKKKSIFVLMSNLYIETFIEIEKNLNALGYNFISVESFFTFIENYTTSVIDDTGFDVYLGYENLDNKGLFVCRIEYPK